MSETTCLDRIAGGDQTAVKECIDRYGGLIWSIARRLSPSQDEAEDAVQEIFIELWKSAERFDSSVASEKTFIAMVARRRLIDRLRRTTQRPNLQSLEEANEVADDHQLRMEQSIEAGPAYRAMAELKPEQRRVLKMSIHLGMSHGEIVEATQIPMGTVKSHIRRGLALIRDRLSTSVPGHRGAS